MHHHTDIKAIREVIRDLLVTELLPVLLNAMGSGDQSEPALLSRDEAAKLLGVSVQTIASLMKDGSIEHVRVRRRVLVPHRSLREYMSRSNPKTDSGAKA